MGAVQRRFQPGDEPGVAAPRTGAVIEGNQEGGVYIIARSERLGRRQSLSSENIIYIGQTTRTVGVRLYRFARACQERGGHAGGSTYFDMHGQGSWEGEQDSISVAIWTPPEDWEEEFDLSLGAYPERLTTGPGG